MFHTNLLLCKRVDEIPRQVEWIPDHSTRVYQFNSVKALKGS